MRKFLCLSITVLFASSMTTLVFAQENYQQPPISPALNAPCPCFPPLKQFKSGIPANYINCKQGLQLIIKAEDNLPACVKPDTAQKLIERGWTKEIISTTVSPQPLMENRNHVTVTFLDGFPSLSATMTQGDTLQIPWQLFLDKNYSTGNLQMTVYTQPHIEATILPIMPFTRINGNPPDNKTITIHADAQVTPGNYTVVVTGTADDITNSMTGKITEMGNKTLAIVHLTVLSRSNQVFFHIGKQKYHEEMFYFPLGTGGGQGYEEFSTYEEVPITIFSNDSSTIQLRVENIQQGSWVSLFLIKSLPNVTGLP